MLERVLKDLTEVYIAFKGGGIEPRRESDGAVYRTIDAGEPDGRHIGIDQHDPLVFFRLDSGQGRGGGDRLAVLFQPAHHAAKQLAGGKQGVVLGRTAGGDTEVGKIDSDLLPVLVDKHGRIEVTVGKCY